MKRKCKDVDLRDYRNLVPAIKDVVFRHAGRYDFKNLLVSFGMPLSNYHLYNVTKDRSLCDETIDNIAKECVSRIIHRDLKLSQVEIRVLTDKSTGKIRQIGKESAMQQVFDYIAFYSAKEIFDKRILPEQASSIKGRGQIYGMKLIRGWIDKDNDSFRYAIKHNKRYSRKCRYFVKLDIRKCYPSADIDRFLALFEKDCGNDDVLWLWKSLLKSHQFGEYTGFMIGSLVSQWAVQYMMSFAYRFVKNIHYERRGEKHKSVEHMLIFMDDILMIGSNRKQLKSSVRELIRFCDNELGFNIKRNWQIMDLKDNPIDMMGFLIYCDGHTEIRSRDFIRARRMALRYKSQGEFLTMRQCKRIVSYKGFFKYTDSNSAMKKYHLKEIFNYASKKISKEEKRKNGNKKCSKLSKTGDG